MLNLVVVVIVNVLREWLSCVMMLARVLVTFVVFKLITVALLLAEVLQVVSMLHKIWLSRKRLTVFCCLMINAFRRRHFHVRFVLRAHVVSGAVD